MEFTFKDKLSVKQLFEITFNREKIKAVGICLQRLERAKKSQAVLNAYIEKKIPIYGVTTGFGDSCFRYVRNDLAEKLQENLINYLSCGLGPSIPIEAARAMMVIRLNSLSMGYSGVSTELLEQMRLLLQYDIVPLVPREGSLGASGDLVPLAYLAQVVQGQGQVFFRGDIVDCAEAFKQVGAKPYKLKAKEGLAIVNGTSTMAGLFCYNLKLISFLIKQTEIASAWMCMAINGKREAFGPFINEFAKTNYGQGLVAKNIRSYLDQEGYFPQRGQDVTVTGNITDGFVQDRYSVRCVPQILGPIRENFMHCEEILEHEINSITDNPVINHDGQLEMGGNFYGGYLSQGMDFQKINLAQIADLIDRQITMLIDEKSNRGLTANLTAEAHLSEEERHLHHCLKGVHQAMSAMTSEVMQKSIPSSIFSRSSESHNQDKVSLGMSAAVTCYEMLDTLYKLSTMQLICLAQALDLKEVIIKGEESARLMKTIRAHIPFLKKDTRLGEKIESLTKDLRLMAMEK